MSADISPSDGKRLQSFASPGLHGQVDVPGDKSISHRALILGGLAEGETWIDGLLEGDDVISTAAAVRAFGASVDRASNGKWRIVGSEWRSPRGPIDCGNSGTGARLLMGAAAAFPIEASFTGDLSLSSRPMSRVLDPLSEMGARVSASEGGRLPATIMGGDLRGISFVNARASAQVKSAILLAGLGTQDEVVVVELARSRDHTENMLRAFGCDVELEGDRISLGKQRKLTATNVQIPGDPSSAAFPIVAALISPGSQVRVRSVMINPLRAGLLTSLAEMGAELSIENRRSAGGEEVADISARFSRMRGITVPAERAPSMIDEYPILAIAAAFAEGRTVMHGLGELRVKESDRLAAIIAGLVACGVDAREDGDSLIVEGCGGAPAGGASVAACHDHRIAMSFLVLGLGSSKPVEVDSAAMIATSFPDFAPLMRSLGARLS
jgi:3-phosphoshikimate 1-carboxyvinyltransferase